jgi:hypothetical protein
MLGNGAEAIKWPDQVVQAMNPVRPRISDGPALYCCCRYSNTRRPLLDMGFDTWFAVCGSSGVSLREKAPFDIGPILAISRMLIR